MKRDVAHTLCDACGLQIRLVEAGETGLDLEHAPPACPAFLRRMEEDRALLAARTPPKIEFCRETLEFSIELPARFDGLVGVYPLTLFRPEFVQTFPSPIDLYVDGAIKPCDGSIYRIDPTHALEIGSFIAFDARSRSDKPARLMLDIRGTTIEPGAIGFKPLAGLTLVRAPVTKVGDPAPRGAP